MSSKRGVIEESGKILIWLIAAAVVILIFILFSSSIISLLTGKVSCSNKEQWNVLKSSFDSLDSNTILSDNIIFFNGECKIASFSPNQALQNYNLKPNFEIGSKPKMCLCQVKESTCIPYDCFTFDNFDKINDEQFSTLELKPYVYISFSRDNKILRAYSNTEKIDPEPVRFIYNPEYSNFDKAGLVSELLVKFNSLSLKAVIPKINLVDKIPESVPKVESFSTHFTLDLLASVSDEQPIDNSLIDTMLLIISVPKDKFNSLPIKLKDKVVLYYKNSDSWIFSPLTCKESIDSYDCRTSVSGNPRDFVLTASAQNSGAALEAELSDFISQTASRYKLKPELVKAIIKAGNPNWDSLSVNSCDTAGLTQLPFDVAKNHGLNKNFVGYSNSWCPDEETSVCKVYDKDSKQFVKTISSSCSSCDTKVCDYSNDERFNPKKEIETTSRYLLEIKRVLKLNNLDYENVMFIAASYYSGVDAVADSKGVPDYQQAKDFASSVNKYYSEAVASQ